MARLTQSNLELGRWWHRSIITQELDSDIADDRN